MLICALKPHAAEKPRPQIEGRKNADAGDERDHPAAREIADGERSHIDHRPGEGEAAHDEAKARVTGDPGANGDCLVTVQSQRDRANPHLPYDPTEGFRGCAMIKSAANPGRALPGNLACRG